MSGPWIGRRRVIAPAVGTRLVDTAIASMGDHSTPDRVSWVLGIVLRQFREHHGFDIELGKTGEVETVDQDISELGFDLSAPIAENRGGLRALPPKEELL